MEKVKISRGSWFLCRPGGDGLMWFGHVEDVFRRFGCDGEAWVLVKAKWYRAPRGRQVPRGITAPLDMQLRCPVVSARPIEAPTGPWYLPESIVPWHCMALPHPRSNMVLGVIARHWHHSGNGIS